MSWRSRILLAVAWGAGLVLAADAHAERVVLPPRAGQVGLGVQGQYGTLLEAGSLGRDFGAGPGLAVRLRYRMRYERGIGLSFESQGFDARESTGDSVRANLFTAGFEVYQMFSTRTKTTRMLSVGAGLAKLTVKLKDGETEFPTNDGLYVSAGAGLEHFFWQAWAYDLSTRYLVVFQDGKANHDVQISLGLIFYTSY